MIDVLRRFERNGCEVDFSTYEFKIVDREAFLKYLLDERYYWYCNVSKDDETWLGKARIADAIMSASYCTMPCVFDGNIYKGLFFALRHTLLRENYEPEWIEIVNVYDCHY